VALALGVALLAPAAVSASANTHRRGAERAGARIPSRVGTPTVTYSSLTSKKRDPFWITPGPDGNMWFTNPGGDTIGRITPKGVVTEFKLAKGTHPQTITAAGDGNLWFTMRLQDAIGVMDTSGKLIHIYSAQQPSATPYSIAPSPDGAVWFTDYALDSEDTLDKVERMTLDGNTVDKFDLASCGCAPLGATYGPDGNMWFTEELGFTPNQQGNGDGTVDRVSLDGKTIDRFDVRTDFTQTLPSFMAPGPDGNVWFTEASGTTHNLDRVTPAGTVTEFHIADTPESTNGVTTGADGDIWFTETGNTEGDVWRMHPDGSLIGAAITAHPFPVGIALGPDGNLWFAARADGEIGVIHAAPRGRSFVLDIASGFTPALRTVPIGRTVEWVLEAPGMHRVHDDTGMDLYDSGPQPPVSFTTFRFPAAGTWAYEDRPGGRRGKIGVNLIAPATMQTGSSQRIGWANADAPAGALFDVQIRRPGDSGFSPFRASTTDHGGAFSPHVAGAYRFRSRMRTADGGTGYSPVHTIRVS
jgi:virginiamycin B lyase